MTDNTADSIYGLSGAAPTTVNETISFRDDASHIRGTHAFKFGYESAAVPPEFRRLRESRVLYSFTGSTTGLKPNGDRMPNTGTPSPAS